MEDDVEENSQSAEGLNVDNNTGTVNTAFLHFVVARDIFVEIEAICFSIFLCNIIVVVMTTLFFFK